ncbi:glycosyltransferase [Microlunatus speluncae]|uniref:glycosyltransferase n=1 Tax=Microlunatus speluncae TaxID=2594267 RepID=UPI001266845E|nr:glycosyltransferase [Microlunatus speluncae]
MPDSDLPADRPTVAVWRDVWLPPSETFIRDQMAAMARWQGVRVGMQELPDPLVPADFAPFTGASRLRKLRGELLGTVGWERQYVNFLMEAEAQVLHAHFGPSAIRALPVAKRAGLPMVATFHGYDVTRVPRLPMGRGREYRRRLRRLFDYADRLVAVSDFIADRLIALGAPESRVTVHYTGIDVRGIDAASPLLPRSDRNGIVFVGRLVPKKGVLDLLDAVAQLPEDLRKTPITMLGDGPLAGEARRRADAAGLDLTLAGFRTSDEVAAMLDRAAVFCVPSRTGPDGDAEGFGMVFLEAGLHGAPVVSYAHGPLREAVAHGTTGLLAQEKDVAGLAAHLEHVLTDDQLADRLGRQGRQRVLEQFDIRHCTAALETIYDEVTTP